MSRAFVREQDVNAPDELPDRVISSHPNHVTKEGMDHLKLMLETAREAHAAATQAHDRSALAVALRDLRYWSVRRASARVIRDPTDTTEVRFGSWVSIRRSDGREQAFRIVGEDEANPSQGTISHASPMARALIGKGLSDVATLGTVKIEILGIRQLRAYISASPARASKHVQRRPI